jgi:lysozyme family protein
MLCRADELVSGVDYCVFDVAVNSGPGRAIKFLQSRVSVLLLMVVSGLLLWLP